MVGGQVGVSPMAVVKTEEGSCGGRVSQGRRSRDSEKKKTIIINTVNVKRFTILKSEGGGRDLAFVGICGSPEICASKLQSRLWGVKLYCGVKNY